MSSSQENLIRKQFLVSRHQVEKIEKLAAVGGTSAGNIVRAAIDAYEPMQELNSSEIELLELANERIQEAIKVTQAAHKRLKQTRDSLHKKDKG